MAVQILPPTGNAHSSDVQFRNWGSAISNGIVAAGIPKTADTGQINWTTVTRPTTNTAAGYEIFRLDDALQATRPVFIKLQYGTNQSSASNPQIWIGIGTATDGAGTLTAHASLPNTFDNYGVAIQQPVMYNSSTVYTSAEPRPIWIDSDGGSSLMVAGWFNLPSSDFNASGVSFVVERTRNWDGTVNGEGVTRWSGSGNQVSLNGRTLALRNAPQLATQMTATSAGYSLYPLMGTPATGWVDNSQYFYPYFTGFTPQMHGPSKHVIGVVPADMPVMAQFDLTHYGATNRWVVSNAAWSSLRPVFRIT